MTKPIPRYDLPAEKFPVLILAVHAETRAVVWSTTIEEPDDQVLIRIPNLRKTLGHPVAIRIVFADGEIQEDRATRAN